MYSIRLLQLSWAQMYLRLSELLCGSNTSNISWTHGGGYYWTWSQFDDTVAYAGNLERPKYGLWFKRTWHSSWERTESSRGFMSTKTGDYGKTNQDVFGWVLFLFLVSNVFYVDLKHAIKLVVYLKKMFRRCTDAEVKTCQNISFCEPVKSNK